MEDTNITQFNIAEAKANKPLLKLTSVTPEKAKVRMPGSGKHEILHIADDFDAIPEGFEDYI